MKGISYQFNEEERKAYRENKNNRERFKFLKQTAIAFFTGLSLMAASFSSAHAFDWNKFYHTFNKVANTAHVSGAAIGSAVAPKKANDTKRAGYAAAGVIAGEIVSKTLKGERLDINSTLFDAGAAGAGAALAKQSDSKTKKAVYAAGAVVGARILKRAVEINVLNNNNQYQANQSKQTKIKNQNLSQSQLGKTKCKRIIERVYENGQWHEKIKEICVSEGTFQGYSNYPKKSGLRR